MHHRRSFPDTRFAINLILLLLLARNLDRSVVDRADMSPRSFFSGLLRSLASPGSKRLYALRPEEAPDPNVLLRERNLQAMPLQRIRDRPTIGRHHAAGPLHGFKR